MDSVIQRSVAHQGMTLTAAHPGRSDKEVASWQQTYSQQTHQSTQMHSCFPGQGPCEQPFPFLFIGSQRVLEGCVYTHTLWKKCLGP